MKAIILAGGKGTRLGNLSHNLPKPMLRIGGKPLLEHQILLLKRYGIKKIIIITHHFSNVIEEYFQSGEAWGVHISYFKEPKPLGTAGSIKCVEDRLQDEDFLVLYGDLLMDMDLSKLIDFHKQHKGIASLVVHPNNHPYDSDLLEINEHNQITAFHSKPHDDKAFYPNLVNAAIYAFSPKIFNYLELNIKTDFGKDIFPKLYLKTSMYAYRSAEYIKDIGTIDRVKQAEKDFASGKVSRLNAENQRNAIFLDRDGVINKEINLLHRVEDFELLPNVTEALKLINQSDYLAILITNQPIIARNMASIEQLKEIHAKMESLLGKEHAYLDAIYFCPHHPDKGYPEENVRYKTDCNCRKPKIGMLLRAQKHFNIDLKYSYFIGDSDRDIQCALNAGVTPLGVAKNGELPQFSQKPPQIFNDLLSAVEFIMKKGNK